MSARRPGAAGRRGGGRTPSPRERAPAPRRARRPSRFAWAPPLKTSLVNAAYPHRVGANPAGLTAGTWGERRRRGLSEGGITMGRGGRFAALAAAAAAIGGGGVAGGPGGGEGPPEPPGARAG